MRSLQENQVLLSVDLCCCSWVPPAGQRPIPLALACGIPITTPGAYNITFSVTNSAGATASVTRQMTIVGACGAGAALCPDKVSLLLNYIQTTVVALPHTAVAILCAFDQAVLCGCSLMHRGIAFHALGDRIVNVAACRCHAAMLGSAWTPPTLCSQQHRQQQ